eukprot:PITA_23571
MSLTEDLVFLILQFLNEEKLTEAAHMLERESGLYFNVDYLEELVITGKFDEAERYLLGFIKIENNKHSTKIFFEIRKQKYLEALDRKDRFTAMNILNNDLRVFKNISKEVYREIAELITLDDFRENEQLKQYRDTQSQRVAMFREISSIVQSNPLLCNKLAFPSIKACRLRALINQSLNWQHTLCKIPQPSPDIRTLFDDHTCAASNGAQTPSPVNSHLMGSIQKMGAFCPIPMPALFQPQVGPPTPSPAGWLANPGTDVQHAAVASGAASLFPRLNAGALLQLPRTPPACNGGFLFQLTDSKHVIEPPGCRQTWHLGPTHPKERSSENDLPKIVVRNLNQGSNVVSMDFHPQHETILLVGTDVGDIAIWEVGTSEKLTQKSFKDWDNSIRILSMQV